MSTLERLPHVEHGESVVLLDEAGEAIGTAPKRSVHHDRTPLHLAFSVYLFDQRTPPSSEAPSEAGVGSGPSLLLTRRALHKVTWPGVWTNSCCGHPAPGEAHADAVRRRVRQELGVGIDDLRLVLPRFRYRAVMADGVVENEMCPVYVGTVAGELRPDPDEVDDTRWVAWPAFHAEVLAGARQVSPWCVEQVRALPPDAPHAAAEPPDGLPPAARP